MSAMGMKNHQLVGNLKDFRECHIRPDWLLIYQKKDDILILAPCPHRNTRRPFQEINLGRAFYDFGRC